MKEDGYRYSRVKIISWIIAMVLGTSAWYCIYLLGKEVYRSNYVVPFHHTVHLL